VDKKLKSGGAMFGTEMMGLSRQGFLDARSFRILYQSFVDDGLDPTDSERWDAWVKRFGDPRLRRELIRNHEGYECPF
jgi:hypothetical protein